ncbi:hypothetical protein ACE939_08750 [Aquimarina sp. W85]|uniref:hypothetical protein n=1 Tax=Aquimarina rhodophyticola TaxID=3342246 RepID=UPI003671DCF9
MKKLTSTLVICLIASIVTAQTESSIEINQSGYDNETNIEQEGATYTTINQLYEFGHDNSGTIFQWGRGNFSYADIDQFGSFNAGTITQDGESQSAWIKQGNVSTISNNNIAIVSQKGFANNNVTTQLYDNNTASLTQEFRAN